MFRLWKLCKPYIHFLSRSWILFEAVAFLSAGLSKAGVGVLALISFQQYPFTLTDAMWLSHRNWECLSDCTAHGFFPQSFPLSTSPNCFSSLPRAFTDFSPLILQSVANVIKVPAPNQPIMLAFITCSLHLQSHISPSFSQAIPCSWSRPTISPHTAMPLTFLKSTLFAPFPNDNGRVRGGCVPRQSHWSQRSPVIFPSFCTFLSSLSFGWWPLWGQRGLCARCDGGAKVTTLTPEELGRMKNIHAHLLNSN